MTQVSSLSRAQPHTRVKRLASFQGWGKLVEQLHTCSPNWTDKGLMTDCVIINPSQLLPINLDRKAPENRRRGSEILTSGPRPKGTLAVGCPSQLAGSCSSTLRLPRCSGQGTLPGMECLWDNRTWIPAAITNCLCRIRRPRKSQPTQNSLKKQRKEYLSIARWFLMVNYVYFCKIKGSDKELKKTEGYRIIKGGHK